MNANHYFSHSDHRVSEELAFFAEKDLRRGKIIDAEQKFYEAAKKELNIALSVSEDEAEREFREIFSISAVSLFLKARQWAESRKYACLFLSRPELISERAQFDLQGLLEKASRELLSDEMRRKDSSTSIIDLVLSGGRVGFGNIPFDAAAQRRELVNAFLIRTWEYLSGKPFRTRGPSGVSSSICILEQPSFAGSFGVRFAITNASSLEPLPTDAVLPVRLVDEMIEIATVATNITGDLVSRLGLEYARTIMRILRDLAGDGSYVGETRLFRSQSYSPSVCLDYSCREMLTERVARLEANQVEATPLSLEGILKVVSLRGKEPKIEVQSNGSFRRLRIENGIHDDTIGVKVNRLVKITGYENLERDDEVNDWAFDIQLIEC